MVISAKMGKKSTAFYSGTIKDSAMEEEHSMGNRAKI